MKPFGQDLDSQYVSKGKGKKGFLEQSQRVPTFDVSNNNSISLISNNACNRTVGSKRTKIVKSKTGISSPRTSSITSNKGERQSKSSKRREKGFYTH